MEPTKAEREAYYNRMSLGTSERIAGGCIGLAAVLLMVALLGCACRPCPKPAPNPCAGPVTCPDLRAHPDAPRTPCQQVLCCGAGR